MRKLFSFFLSLSLILACVEMASAQETAYAALSTPDVSAFPKVSAILDAFDGNGQFIAGLKPEDLTLLEDGQPRPVDALTPFQPGTHVIVTINPGAPFAVRDAEGISRYEHAMTAVRTWVTSLPKDTPDIFSLVTIAGPQVTNASPNDWLINFTAYQPDFNATKPSLQSLAFAHDIAVAAGKAPGMKSAILYITPHFDPRDIGTLEALQARLAASRVRTFVWFLDAQTYFNDPTATAAKALALQTGGQYFAFSGTETFPDPATYFAPLHNAYRLEYTSAVNVSGAHTLEVNIASGAQTLSTAQTFNVDVQPPNAFLFSPPMQIVRQPPPDDPYNDEVLLPEEQPLTIFIEFPDGHPRPLVRTALYVDDEIVAVNESEPFNRFTWDIRSYTSSGIHQLKVEAVDSLGLSRVSLNVPVAVTVILPPRGLAAFFGRYRIAITAGAIGLAGLLLIGVLFWGHILRLPSPRRRREERRRYADPVTQPLSAHIEQAEPPRLRLARMRWPRQPNQPEAPAYLIRLNAAGEPTNSSPIALLGQEITFGTDPVQAVIVLDDKSISPLHARLRQTPEGGFILADQGSVAGTWVNYEPLDREGRFLAHGDIIHFGQLRYRFTLRDAPVLPPPTITPEASE